MSPVAVVTDTTQYLPAPLLERHGIGLVSLYVTWEGRTEPESAMDGYADFYGHLRDAAQPPSTSQPSVGDFLAAFEPRLERGDDVLAILLSGAISGTVHAAEQARTALIERGVAPERLTVLDSRTGCGGHGLMAIAAANAARAGANLAEAEAAARALRADFEVLLAVDDLEYLRRGGRIGAAQAWIGTTLRVKPLLTIDGEIQPVERVRTSSRAFERLVAHLERRKADGCDTFAVQHVQSPAEAARLADRGRALFGTGPLFVSEIGPVIGAHTGPGLLACAALRSELTGPV